MKTVVFFNNKGGVGKTTTVYHLSWMLGEMNNNVLAIDLDPQSNLSSMFLSQERMEEAVLDENKKLTILDAVIPVGEGEGYQPVHIEKINDHISLLIGNLALSAFEDKLSDAWTKCLAGDVFGFKVSSIFKTLIDDAVTRSGASWVLMSIEARKPMFLLKPADGAIGAHVQAVHKSYTDFKNLAGRIIEVCV
jgi:chromosome partitioning protein